MIGWGFIAADVGVFGGCWRDGLVRILIEFSLDTTVEIIIVCGCTEGLDKIFFISTLAHQLGGVVDGRFVAGLEIEMLGG